MRVNIETGLPSNGNSQETIMEAFVDSSIPGEKAGHGAPVRGKPSMGLPEASTY